MLSKALTTAFRSVRTPNMLMRTAQRGLYTDATKPHVFINEHTKVLVQGMTGKHVSILITHLIWFDYV